MKHVTVSQSASHTVEISHAPLFAARRRRPLASVEETHVGRKAADHRRFQQRILQSRRMHETKQKQTIEMFRVKKRETSKIQIELWVQRSHTFFFNLDPAKHFFFERLQSQHVQGAKSKIIMLWKASLLLHCFHFN